MSGKKTTWARLQLLVIAAVFFGPLAVASWMYYSGAFMPAGRTNHGTLLKPIINIFELQPDSTLGALGDGYWLLIYASDEACAADCKQALHTLRQSRKMLGSEMDRLLRVFLHGETPPDTVFLANEHAGLIARSDSGLSALLTQKKPAVLSPGGYFLVDPLGNLVMYFEPGLDPSLMVEDIKRLLKLSRIG